MREKDGGERRLDKEREAERQEGRETRQKMDFEERDTHV